MTTVQFIGSGDSFGSGGRLQTCILVDDDGWRCLIDCGASSLIGLRLADIDPASIDAVVVSHLHGDHFGGLPFVMLDAQFNSRRSTPLLIVGHADLEPRLRLAMEVLFPGSQRAFDVVDVEFLTIDSTNPVSLGSASVQVFDVEHSCGSPPFAIRLTTPSKSVVSYSGDTEWTDTLVAAAEGADLFVVEASFFEKVVPGHLNYPTLAGNLPRLNATRIIATHLGADVLAHADSLDIETAYDGLTVVI
jgi:ribonuclease BN (tRNA processing enzyme)